MRAFAIIPTLDEREAIAEAVRQAAAICAGVVVVDGGSRDGTREAAAAAGAAVVLEPRRGYGRAVRRGVEVARRAGAEAYVIFDGNGSVAPDDLCRVLAPVAAGEADLALGARSAASLRPLQRVANRLAVELVARGHGLRCQDVAALRVVTAQALAGLGLREEGHGWPLDLLLRAASARLRVVELEVRPRPRRGRSKVSGTWRGGLRAALGFGRVLARFYLDPRGQPAPRPGGGA